jgi:hypothetical protein
MKSARNNFLTLVKSLKKSINQKSDLPKARVYSIADFRTPVEGGGGAVEVPPVKCSTLNNINHPKLDARQAFYLLEVSELLARDVNGALPLLDNLDSMGFDVKDLIIAVSTLNNYKTLIDTTLSLEKNERLANYAFNKKLGGAA